MTDLSERKRLRETRARPWLVNSVISRVKKVTCKAEPLDTPKGHAVAQKAPPLPAKSVDTLLFEEEVAKTLDSLSLAARPSRIPRWVAKRSPQGCNQVVATSSEDELKEGHDKPTRATLPGGGKQVGTTSRIPIPRRLVGRFRGKVTAGTKSFFGDWSWKRAGPLSRPGVETRETPCLKSCLRRRVPKTGNHLDNESGYGVKSKPTVVKKVHFSSFGPKRDVYPYRLRTVKKAPLCRRHSSCRKSGLYTCLRSKDSEETPQLEFEDWCASQLKMDHNYFEEYRDVLVKSFVGPGADGRFVRTAHPLVEGVLLPARNMKAINSL